MWNRLHVTRFRALARQFPAVLILGPRQVGKTTLARDAFPKAPYLDLEQPGLRQLFAGDPLFQIESRLGKTGALVLDEVQCVPEVFSALRPGLARRGFAADPEWLRWRWGDLFCFFRQSSHGLANSELCTTSTRSVLTP